MTHFFVFFACCVAVERLAELGTTVDFLDDLRAWWDKSFPKYAKLSSCKFCQSFWASGVLSLVLAASGWPGIVAWPVEIVVSWLSVWGGSLVVGEFMDRYLNRAPVSVMMMQPTDDQESES